MIGLLWWWMAAGAQELLVKININSQQIEGSDKSVFDNLKQTLEQWMNDRQWTDLQFQKNERINVNFNITVVKRDKTNNRFTCTALIQANRPVFNSTYTTTLYNNKDEDFNFDFAQFDQLNYNDEVVDNQLTALVDSPDGILCLPHHRTGLGLVLTPGRYGDTAALHAADHVC